MEYADLPDMSLSSRATQPYEMVGTPAPMGHHGRKCQACGNRAWVMPSGDRSLSVPRTTGMAFLIAVALGAPWMFSAPSTDPQTAASTHAPVLIPTPDDHSPLAGQLVLVSARAHEGEIGDFWFVEGEVRNVTKSVLDHVEAISSWFDDHGVLIATDSAVIDTFSLRPGQTSRFKTMTRSRPDLSTFQIGFRTSGTLLPAAMAPRARRLDANRQVH